MRHVIVWSLDHSVFQYEGSYDCKADGKVLLYCARKEYPGHDIESVTDETFSYLESIA